MLAVFLPIPMILSADIMGQAAGLLFFSSFFAFMIPMQVVRAEGKLPMPEFMTLGGIMMASWMLLVFIRAVIFGILGMEL